MRRLPDGTGGFVIAADDDLPAHMATLLDRAHLALAANDSFLALQNPTQGQAVAQAQSLTRQVNALVRLQVGAFDSAGGSHVPFAAPSRRVIVADRARPFLPWAPGVAALVLAVLGPLGVF